jgi:hypothetical protein
MAKVLEGGFEKPSLFKYILILVFQHKVWGNPRASK